MVAELRCVAAVATTASYTPVDFQILNLWTTMGLLRFKTVDPGSIQRSEKALLLVSRCAFNQAINEYVNGARTGL